MSSREIRVLIADDEAPSRRRLKSLLSGYSEVTIIAEAENGDQVLTEINGVSPDVAFLDINMPGASVFTTIPSLRNPPLIVFQTAYSEYGVKAFDMNAVDYLMKPVSRQRFGQAMEKVENALNREPQSGEVSEKKKPKDVLSVKSGETIRIVRIDRILRISIKDGFSFLHMDGESLYTDRSLNSYEELLAEKGFYRISRSNLIKLSCISRVLPLFKGQYLVELQNGDRLTVSRRRIQGLKEKIG